MLAPVEKVEVIPPLCRMFRQRHQYSLWQKYLLSTTRLAVKTFPLKLLDRLHRRSAVEAFPLKLLRRILSRNQHRLYRHLQHDQFRRHRLHRHRARCMWTVKAFPLKPKAVHQQ